MSFIDLSAQKRLEGELKAQREALFQSEKLNALGTLLAGVAHELNNPLTVVVANAHVLSMSSDDPMLAARVEKITNAAERCSKIVRTFLAMARKGQGEKRPFHVADAIESALGICRFGFKEHQVQLEADVAPDLPLMLGDADQIAQVVINLLLNAQHALADQPAPRKVRLCCRHDAVTDQVTLEVSDNGPGVPENIKTNIFDPFFTTKQVGSGTGLGLFLVRGTVRSHGGSIELLSADEEYRGACFRVQLPVGKKDTGIARRKEAALPPDVSAKRILIVDDEPDILDVLKDILGNMGHQVVSAASGAEALERIRENPIDAVISDIRMPGMSGPDLFEALKANHPALVAGTIFMTGDNLSVQARGFLEASGRPVLHKPFAPDEVKRLITELPAT